MPTLTTEKFNETFKTVLAPEGDLVHSVVATKNAIAESEHLRNAYLAAIATEAFGTAIVTQMLFAAVFEAGRRIGSEEAMRAMLEGK